MEPKVAYCSDEDVKGAAALGHGLRRDRRDALRLPLPHPRKLVSSDLSFDARNPKIEKHWANRNTSGRRSGLLCIVFFNGRLKQGLANF